MYCMCNVIGVDCQAQGGGKSSLLNCTYDRTHVNAVLHIYGLAAANISGYCTNCSERPRSARTSQAQQPLPRYKRQLRSQATYEVPFFDVFTLLTQLWVLLFSLVFSGTFTNRQSSSPFASAVSFVRAGTAFV